MKLTEGLGRVGGWPPISTWIIYNPPKKGKTPKLPIVGQVFEQLGKKSQNWGFE